MPYDDPKDLVRRSYDQISRAYRGDSVGLGAWAGVAAAAPRALPAPFLPCLELLFHAYIVRASGARSSQT